MFALAPVLVFLVIVLFSSLRIIKEYERGVVYTLGNYTGTVGPGPRFIIPLFQDMTKVSIQIDDEAIPSQDVISRDNVSVKVNAVVYYQVVEPSYAINRVKNYMSATSQLAQTTLRSVLGKQDLDEILSNREQLNTAIQAILDQQTESWGVKVTHVEIKNVDLDPTMIRAMAKQAEAERERRAKIINAEGELQAAQKLDEAATILAQRPETMQLRYLGTLGEFVNAKGSTVLLPLPLDAVGGMKDLLKKVTG